MTFDADPDLRHRTRELLRAWAGELPVTPRPWPFPFVAGRPALRLRLPQASAALAAGLAVMMIGGPMLLLWSRPAGRAAVSQALAPHVPQRQDDLPLPAPAPLLVGLAPALPAGWSHAAPQASARSVPAPTSIGQPTPAPYVSHHTPVVTGTNTVYVCGLVVAGLCTGGSTNQSGPTSIALDGYVCPHAAQPSYSFSFDTEQEIDFNILDGNGSTLWTWSTGQRFQPDAHRVTVPAADCADWQTTWDRTTSTGETVPAGTYRVVATSLAHEMSGGLASWTWNFTLT